MTNITPLTNNGVSILAYSNTNQPAHCSFTFQVLSIQKGPIDDDGSERFRIILSDGQLFIKGLLAYKSNEIGSKLSKHDIVGLSSYCSVTNSDKALIILYNLYVIHSSRWIGKDNLKSPRERGRSRPLDHLPFIGGETFVPNI
jgi:hypothetical protein